MIRGPRSRNTRVGSSFGLCSIPTASAAVSSAMDLRSMEAEDLSRRRHLVCTGGQRSDFRQEHQLGCMHRARRVPLYQQGAFYANGEFIQVHRPAFPAKTSCASCLSQLAARVAASGCQELPATASRQSRSLSATAGTSLKIGIPSTATWCRAMWPRALSQGPFTSSAWASMGQPIGLSRPDPQSIKETLNPQARGQILEIYEKFVGDDHAKCR